MLSDEAKYRDIAGESIFFLIWFFSIIKDIAISLSVPICHLSKYII